jgi:hypothetical protein
MTEIMFALFAIPVICIVIIAISQFGDEMFKKKFVINRRDQPADEKDSAQRPPSVSPSQQNRRYSDSETPRTSQRSPESLEPKNTPLLNPSVRH